jgi:Subtilisin inhibitor-like
MIPLAGLPGVPRSVLPRSGPRPSGPRRSAPRPSGPLSSGRRRVRLAMLTPLAAAAIAVTGCAASGSAGGGSGAGGGAAPAKVSLAFQVRHGSGPTVRHWTLRCEPSGGTHPAAAATCAALLRMKNPFAPPKHMNCPMILRSDRRIVVSGTWFGKKVHRVILDGGCDLRLFAKLGQIFH